MNKDRMKIAKSMGWKQAEDESWYREGHPEASTWYDLVFDPLTKAEDCDTLIQWMNEQGVVVVVMHGIHDEKGPYRVNFAYSNIPDPVLYGDNWKQMVCRLAIQWITAAEDSQKP